MGGVKRGDVVTVAAPGDYGKPRPAVVVQSDLFSDELGSVVVCPMTSFPAEAPLFRIPLAPTPANGLTKPSQVMVDKIMPVPKDKLGAVIGALDADTMKRIERAIVVFLGIA